MTATLRLLRIEARRNAGLLLFPFLLLLSWYMLSVQWWTPLLWTSTDEVLQYAVVSVAAPAIAGVAAWMAGRDRRRGVRDLLATTARPAGARRLAGWAGTACWAVLAYAVVAAFVLSVGAAEAVWGGPNLWAVALSVAALLAHAAWGYAIGGVWASRFTAPVVAVSAFALQQGAGGFEERSGEGSLGLAWVTQLAAYQPESHVGLNQYRTLLSVSLFGVGLAAMSLRGRGSAQHWAALSGSAALAVAGVVMVWGESRQYDATGFVLRNNWGDVIPEESLASRGRVCEGSPVAVCARPEFRPLLGDAILSANRLLEPLVGLPGVPSRPAYEVDSWGSGDGTLDPTWFGLAQRIQINVSSFALALVSAPEAFAEGAPPNDAQLAVATWLQERAGLDPGCYGALPRQQTYPGELTLRACDAADRFAALPTARQRAWLERHYPDLRAGKLALEDLP